MNDDDFIRELRRELEGMPELHRKVIEQRFGLLDQKPQTVEEVAEALNLPRARVRMLETKVLRKLTEFRKRHE